ncbi:nucleotidyltransferase family protein [Gelidibacter japonicus]|uniref:nucleotidyltransferase family protein n=1 Tax=Gelidibacter japonicus TaxID=1962232 RepID=UPI003A95468E
MELNDILISEDSDILYALKKLNNIREVSGLILFVHDKSERIVGSLTDGDIRRSLAEDADINKSVGLICNRNFVFKYDNKGFLDLKPYKNGVIKILPILNDEKRLVRIIDLEKSVAALPIECMIMAGGRGKRLSPLTDEIPKPMLPLGNMPIIEHNINHLIRYGIKKIYISLNYLGEQIQDYFGDGSQKGINIEYVWEDKFLGTAGSLALVDEFKSDNILLMNSDLFTNVDFEAMYIDLVKFNADMVVASTIYKVDVPYAVFDTNENQILDFKEKPTYVYHSNAGIYILNKRLIDKIPKNEFYDITDLMESVVKDGGKLIHNPILGFWIDIGKPDDYIRAQELVEHIH